MSQIEKLKALQGEKKLKSSMTRFDDIVAVNVGVTPTIHYPKLKDEHGNNLKDDKGKDLRSDVSDGMTYTFSEFGTAKTVKIVLNTEKELPIMAAFKMSGLGYDIKSAGLIFIEKADKFEVF